MKITFFMLLVLVTAVHAEGMAQKVTLSLKNEKIEDVFTEITKQTSFEFLYSDELIRKARPVTIQVRNVEVEDALRQIISKQNMTYKVIEKTVIVNLRPTEPAAPQKTKPLAAVQQDIRLTGIVSDQGGNPLEGASVSVKGNPNAGTLTNAEGQFSLVIPNTNVTLEISYIGYATKTVELAGRQKIEVVLELQDAALDEVVVTALGIVRERKALGYSVTEVKGESLTQAREVNVGNSLVGRVAGVNVSSVAGGAGSSVNIQIRGMSSISSSNQPLYVINGVPMTNETSMGTGTGSVVDRGDNIGNINPDDIESMSVLKGAAASALYGSRAKAGVILITTKSGRAGEAASLEFSSNYVASTIIDQTDFQYEYGQGEMAVVDGSIVFNRPTSASNAVATGLSSWGPKIDGQPTIQADGVERPYTAAENSIKDFYRTGGTWTNTLAFSKGFEGGAVRFSASNLSNTGVTPNSSLDRQSLNLSAIYNVTKRLNVDVRANYIIEGADNRPKISDISSNVHNSILLYANTIDLRDFKDVVTTPSGAEFPLNGNVYVANPWFTMKHYQNQTRRNRLIASGTLRYNFDNGAFIQGRIGRDYYQDRYKEVIPTGTAYSLTGRLTEETLAFSEINADVLAGMPIQLTSDIILTPNIGASLRNVNTEGFNAGGTGFAVPYVYQLNNVPSRTITYDMTEEESHSVYGTLELDYKRLLYLTGTGRTDWFSTLAVPGGGNPLHKFYPSISGSFVYSELFPGASWLDFGKLRVGYAIVGQATSPYMTALTYRLEPLPLGSHLVGNISNSTVPNTSLRASQSSELEVGTEMRFFDNRVQLDLAWYRKLSTDEIVNAPSSITSGYSAASLNLGKLKNEGIEAMVTWSPLRSANGFNWTTSFNGTMNNNRILALAPGTSSLVWATARRGPAYIQYIVGKPAAQVMAIDYARNPDGSVQINPSSGLAMPATALTAYGSAYARWIAGWANDFSYKNFNLSVLIDGKFGGKIYSNTESESYTSGKNKETLVGRDQIWGNNQSAMEYYRNMVRVSSNFVEDASFIKFRQLILGYNFPKGLFNNTIKSLNISFVARNLFILMKHTDNIDPEAAYTGAATGLDMGTVPAQRTYGINLNARF